MYDYQISKINYTINKTGKAIVALGCSFVQGQGAYNDELYEKYNWVHPGMGYPLRIEASLRDKKEIASKYNDIKLDSSGFLDMNMMEYSNAFVNVLCMRYFGGEYAPINFGMRGTGNRGQMKELYFRPEINWDKIKELIVIYCPSGIERFDFVNDLWPEHFHFKAMWPQNPPPKNPEDVKDLWKGYGETIYSEKQGIIEQIGHVQELLNWCKVRNAKLIITPGFDGRYNKDTFCKELSKSIERDPAGNIKSITEPGLLSYDNAKGHKKLADLWPWELMFKPEGYNTFVELAMSKEDLKDKVDYFFQFQGKRSPKGWMTPCSHPGQKAHDLFAKLLYNHITTSL